MWVRVLLLLVVLGDVTCQIDKTQIRALKKLLKGMDSGVIATCNIAFFSKLSTFDEADEGCKNFDIGTGRAEKGNLVTVETDSKNDELKLLLESVYPEKEQPKSKWTETKWVWAGLRKTKNNKSKKKSKYNTEDWEWADGTHPIDFYKWLRHQPDGNNYKFGKKGCDEKPRCFQNQMRINHKGQWDDTYKFKTHPYACDYQGKYILAAEKKTWEDAKEACSAAGLHLAKVRSQAEVGEIRAAIEFFLGAADPGWRVWDNNNWIWVGGTDEEEEGVWKWLDGDLVETWDVPWRPPNPDSAAYLPKGKPQNALAISRWGQFDDSFANQRSRKRPFACQCPGS